jgi:hypothetical protein
MVITLNCFWTKWTPKPLIKLWAWCIAWT